MLNYSQIIRIERVSQNMTQQTLAKGICSTSYLSKIEKGHIVPREHIREAILKRLNINSHLLVTSQEEQFLSELRIAFQRAITINRPSHARIVWNHFNQFNIEFSNVENFYLCNLYLQRLAIIANEPIKDIAEISAAFIAMLDQLSHEQRLIYYVNSCHYCLKRKLYKEATLFIHKAHELINRYPTDIEAWLIGDFHLTASKLYYKKYNYPPSISHAYQALHIFEKLDLHIPMINAYVRIGISGNRGGFYDYAKTAFDTAYNFSVQSEKVALYGPILQHLGYNATLRDKSKEALGYYKDSLKYLFAADSICFSIHSIIKEYSKSDDAEKIETWCDRGLIELLKIVDSDSQDAYYYHFSLFKMIHHIVPTSIDLFKDAIDYFYERFDLINVQKYTYVLGEVFMEREQFYEAALCYRHANEIMIQIQNRSSWQDL